MLEVGSYDVNGSVRPIVEALFPARYLGVDVQAGQGVDQVVSCESLCESVDVAAWDVVISCEMLEHAWDWRTCVVQMFSALAPGGWLLLTTRSPGFPYHPFPDDHWRFTNEQMCAVCNALLLDSVTVEDDPELGVFVFAQRPRTAPYVPPDVLQGISVETV